MSISAIRTFLTLFDPVVRRDRSIQAGALCLRDGASGREVLLITSLRTKRWIVPKGWPMPDRSLAQTALQEAWEEAGVRGFVDELEACAYSYDKIRRDGSAVSTRCSLFRVDVRELAEDWPEKKRRERRWVPLAEAATMVDEQELREIFLRLDQVSTDADAEG